MRKNVFLAAVASFVAAGVAMTTLAQPVQAKVHTMTGITCREAAKTQYPADRKERRAYRKACKAHYKALHKGNRHGLLKLHQS